MPTTPVITPDPTPKGSPVSSPPPPAHAPMEAPVTPEVTPSHSLAEDTPPTVFGGAVQTGRMNDMEDEDTSSQRQAVYNKLTGEQSQSFV